MNEINKQDKYEYKKWFDIIDAMCNEETKKEDHYEWDEYVSGKKYKGLHYVLGENLHAYKILSGLDDEAGYSTSDILIFPHEVSIEFDVSDYTDERGVFDAPSLYIAMSNGSFPYFKIGHITGEDYDKREGRIEYMGEKLGIYLPKDKAYNYMDEEQFKKNVDLTAAPDIILSQAEKFAIADNNSIVAKDFADASKFYTKVEDVVKREKAREGSKHDKEDLANESAKETAEFRNSITNIETNESSKNKQEEIEKQEVISAILGLQERVAILERVTELQDDSIVELKTTNSKLQERVGTLVQVEKIQDDRIAALETICYRFEKLLTRESEDHRGLQEMIYLYKERFKRYSDQKER